MQHEYLLRIVEEIARAGSIRGAADFLSITPSALNRRLLGLEGELDTQLFERMSNGVILNPAGEIFITHARRQLADMKTVRSKIADLKGVRRGRVVIAVDNDLATLGSFAQEVATYQAAHEGVTFTIEPTADDDIMQALADYRVDLALQLHPRANANVTSLCTSPVEVNVTMRRTHPALSDGPLRLHEVTGYPWMLPTRGPLRKAIEASAVRQGLGFRVSLEASPNFATATMMGSDAIGFEISSGKDTIYPAHLAHCALAPREYFPMFIHLSQQRGRSLSVAAGRFAEQVRKSFARL